MQFGKCTSDPQRLSCAEKAAVGRSRPSTRKHNDWKLFLDGSPDCRDCFFSRDQAETGRKQNRIHNDGNCGRMGQGKVACYQRVSQRGTISRVTLAVGGSKPFVAVNCIGFRFGPCNLGKDGLARKHLYALASRNPEVALTYRANAPIDVRGIIQQVGTATGAGQVYVLEIILGYLVSHICHGSSVRD
jgi:hypothetical protein